MSSEAVKVMVRVRPINAREMDQNSHQCVSTDISLKQITLTSQKEQTHKSFTYDEVFDQITTQSNIYELSAFSLVESVVEGYNGTIFAYGQTGCGKTYTMMGIPNDENLKGIIPRTFSHIINEMENQKEKNFLLRCSYIEIYNEEIHDLLSSDVRARYEMKESPDKGVFIKDLNQIICRSISDLDKYMTAGTKNRSTGETLMNKDSSRSHSIFTIYLEASQIDEADNQHITAGKLNLVDLAGSERQSKTHASGDRLKEATKINLSLSALGNVISALVDGKSTHIPYRDSKLTRLLQDSLGGNTKTVMIACVSPSSYNYDEILGTLRYASRAKCIQNKPKINEDPKDALLKEYANEILRLKKLLEGKDGNNASNNGEKIIYKYNTITGEREASIERVVADNDKEKYENEIKKREEQLLNEKLEKEKLESLLKDYQSKFFKGGENNEISKKDFLKMKKKLKQQKKLEEELKFQKEEKEKQISKVEKKYQSVSDELEELRKKNKSLSQSLQNAYQEIKDIQKEHEEEKEELLETIRITERENKFNMGLVNFILNPGEYEKIKERSEWDEDENDFAIAPFVLKSKRASFPKIGKNNLEKVLAEKNQREICFIDEESDQQHKNNFKSKKNTNDLLAYYHGSNSQPSLKFSSSQKHNNYGDPNSFNYDEKLEPKTVLLPSKKKINVQLEPLLNQNFQTLIDIKQERKLDNAITNSAGVKKTKNNQLPGLNNNGNPRINNPTSMELSFKALFNFENGIPIGINQNNIGKQNNEERKNNPDSN